MVQAGSKEGSGPDQEAIKRLQESQFGSGESGPGPSSDDSLGYDSLSVAGQLKEGAQSYDRRDLVCIYDLSHLIHRYFQAMMANNPNEPDTTVARMVLGFILKTSDSLRRPVIAACEGVGSTEMKVGLMKHLPSKKALDGTDQGYKGGRDRSNRERMRRVEDLVILCLKSANVPVIQMKGFEADDVIAALTPYIEKETGRTSYVFTNDLDMIPLVTDRTHVFLHSQKRTYAADSRFYFDGQGTNLKGLSKYEQIHPGNFVDSIGDRTAFKASTVLVHYNNVFPLKILRGDSSDRIGGFKGMPAPIGKLAAPKRVAEFMNELNPAGDEEVQKAFRYGGKDERDAMWELFQDFLGSDQYKNFVILWNLFNLNNNFNVSINGEKFRRPSIKVSGDLADKLNNYNANGADVLMMEMNSTAGTLGITIPDRYLL